MHRYFNVEVIITPILKNAYNFGFYLEERNIIKLSYFFLSAQVLFLYHQSIHSNSCQSELLLSHDILLAWTSIHENKIDNKK